MKRAFVLSSAVLTLFCAGNLAHAQPPELKCGFDNYMTRGGGGPISEPLSIVSVWLTCDGYDKKGFVAPGEVPLSVTLTDAHGKSFTIQNNKYSLGAYLMPKHYGGGDAAQAELKKAAAKARADFSSLSLESAQMSGSTFLNESPSLSGGRLKNPQEAAQEEEAKKSVATRLGCSPDVLDEDKVGYLDSLLGDSGPLTLKAGGTGGEGLEIKRNGNFITSYVYYGLKECLLKYYGVSSDQLTRGITIDLKDGKRVVVGGGSDSDDKGGDVEGRMAETIHQD